MNLAAWEESRKTVERLLLDADNAARDIKATIYLLGSDVNVALHDLDEEFIDLECAEENARHMASAFRLAARAALSVAAQLDEASRHFAEANRGI